MESVGAAESAESIGFGIFRVEGVRFGEQITEQDSLLRSAAFRVVLEDGVQGKGRFCAAEGVLMIFRSRW